MSRDVEMVDIEAREQHATEKAWGIMFVPPGEQKERIFWLPKSLCERTGPKQWQVPEWFAIKEGMV